uniref:hypothetical protein n=1 Tax=Flavobacterium sp. TaxID=239 RepID=UPI00404870E2
MSIGLAIGVCQQALAQASVEKGKSVAIEIPVDSDTACNIEVTRGGEKTNVSVDPKSKKGVYEFAGRELGEETIRWEGKMKFRGLKTLGACRGDGSIKVVTTESAEAIEAAKEAQKAEEEAKQARAAMDAQAARLAELEAKLKAAEAEAAKTPEQKAEEARIAAEAKAFAEAKIAAEQKAAAEAKAAEERRLAAEAKAAEERRLAAEAKAAEERRLAAEAKAAEEKRAAAEAKAAEAAAASRRTAAQGKFAGASALQDPKSGAFRSLNPLERYFISKEKSHWNEIQDNGGLQGTFFGLAIFSVANQGQNMFLDTREPPGTVRRWANALCGIENEDWEITRTGSFTSGKSKGLYCDATYQPLSDRQKTWSVSLTGPKVLPDRAKINRVSAPTTRQTAAPSTSENSEAKPKQLGGMPSMASGKYREFCEENWTKKGIIDQGMANYCVEQQTDGYNKALEIISKFADQQWIGDATKFAVEKWTKKGMRQDNMVAFALQQIADGFEEIEIAAQTADFDKRKYDGCYRKWKFQFNMVWYCYKN